MTPPELSSRQDLCDRIEHALTAPHRPPAPLLVGPAGIGKTSLLGLVSRRLESQELRPVSVTASAATRDIALGPFAGLLAALPPDGDADASLALIRHVTGQRNRACLLVDNVDRLDAASLFVVTHFVRDARMPTVLTVRDVTLLPEAIRELYDEDLVSAVTVPPLSGAEAVELAESLLGGALTPAAAAMLVGRAGGNPLYVRELIVGSRSRGVLAETDHGWDFGDLPRATPRLAQLIGAAFADLDEGTLDLVGLLAVTGGLPAGLAPPDQVDLALRRGLAEVDEAGTLGLSHPLYDEALHEQVSAPMIARYRDTAIDLLTQAGDEALTPKLAALHLAAGRRPPVDLALRESRRAQGLMDHARARRLCGTVLETSPDHPEATWLAGAAASGEGDLDDADRLLARAVELADDDPSRSSTARSLAHHLAVRRHEPVRAAEVLEKVLLDLTDPAARSRVEHDLVQWQMVGGLTAIMPAPPAASDDATYTHSLMLTLMVSLISGPISEAEDKARRLEELAPRFADDVPTGPAITRMARFMLLSYSGDIVAAREVAERFLRVEEDQPEMRGSWEYTLGMIELLDDDVERAAELAEKAVEHLRWRDPLGLLGTALALGEAANTALGRFSAAATYAEQIPEFSLADPKVAMLRAWAAAWREQAAGRLAAAAEIIVAAAEQLMEFRHVFLAGMLAHCAARAGHADRALPVLVDAAEAGGGVLDLFRDHARAIADHDDAALALLFEEFDAFGMRATAIDTAALLARRARRNGRVMEARRWDWHANQALSGDTPIALWFHRVEAEIQLSPREREVALFASQRLTSREIGDRLGVSAKTVNNQLGSVYRKLGISGRAELRELLQDPNEPTG